MNNGSGQLFSTKQECSKWKSVLHTWWVVRLHNEDWWIFCIRKLIRFTFKNRELAFSLYIHHVILYIHIYMKKPEAYRLIGFCPIPNCDHSRWDPLIVIVVFILLMFASIVITDGYRPLGVKANWIGRRKNKSASITRLCVCVCVRSVHTRSRRRTTTWLDRIWRRGGGGGCTQTVLCQRNSPRDAIPRARGFKKRERRVKAVRNIHFCHDPAIQSRREFTKDFFFRKIIYYLFFFSRYIYDYTLCNYFTTHAYIIDNIFTLTTFDLSRLCEASRK